MKQVIKAEMKQDGLEKTKEVYGYSFFCPACKEPHVIPTTGPVAWTFNDSLDRLTFNPSVRHTSPPSPYCCHYFIRDGNITFCGDCSHDMKNKTVALSEVTDV